MLDPHLEERIRALVIEIIARYLNRKILAVFTGGTIGCKEARQQLLSCQKEYNLQVDLMFSKAGSAIHNVAELSQEFRGQVFIEGQDRVERWKEYRAIVFAVLTRNTASKAARLLLDSYPAELMIDALMYGMPVIAVKDAADPEIEEWGNIGLNRANAELRQAFQDNLRRLESYGVRLCKSNELHQVLEKILDVRVEQKRAVSSSSTLRLDKRVIIAEDLMPYVGSTMELEVPKGCIITPLASDLLRRHQIKVIWRP